MRDIFISFSVFVCCLIVALASQIISPSNVAASNFETTSQSNSEIIEASSVSNKIFELDPDDPNPTLFAMANQNTSAQDSSSEGAMDTEKSIVTQSGLSITELVVGDGEEASSGQRVTVNYRGTLENGKEFDSSYGRGPFSFPLGL